MWFKKQKTVSAGPAPKGVNPVCPYCEGELDGLWYVTMKDAAGDEGRGAALDGHLAMCPHCRAILGAL